MTHPLVALSPLVLLFATVASPRTQEPAATVGKVPSPVAGQDPAPQSEVPLAPGCSFADPMTLQAPKDFLRGYPTTLPGGLVHAVVEIPTGTTEKWEVELDGVMRWDLADGKPRRVAYLGYPCNYGIVPGAVLGKDMGGDGDPLDMLVLGAAVPRGTVLPVKVIGVIRLIDAGEQDDKLIAVRASTPLFAVNSVDELDARFPGITTILRTWFENYKGGGQLQCQGFSAPAAAHKLVADCEQSFQRSEQAAKQKPASAGR